MKMMQGVVLVWAFVLAQTGSLVAEVASSSGEAILGANDAEQAVWTIKMGTSHTAHSAMLSEEGVWSTAVSLPDAAENCSYHLMMSDDAGNSVAIWTYSDKALDRHVLDAAYLPSGGSWTPPTRISSAKEDVAVFEENMTDAAFKLKVDNEGVAQATWNAYLDGQLNVRSSKLSGGMWSQPVTVFH